MPHRAVHRYGPLDVELFLRRTALLTSAGELKLVFLFFWPQKQGNAGKAIESM